MADVALNGAAVHLGITENTNSRSDFNGITKRSGRSMGFERNTICCTGTSSSEQGTLGGPVWSGETRAWAVGRI